MVYSREEKRVEILGRVGSWDKPPWQNVSLLVAVAWSKVVDYPDVHPAIRLLISVELGPIRREHEDSVV